MPWKTRTAARSKAAGVFTHRSQPYTHTHIGSGACSSVFLTPLHPRPPLLHLSSSPLLGRILLLIKPSAPLRSQRSITTTRYTAVCAPVISASSFFPKPVQNHAEGRTHAHTHACALHLASDSAAAYCDVALLQFHRIGARINPLLDPLPRASIVLCSIRNTSHAREHLLACPPSHLGRRKMHASPSPTDKEVQVVFFGFKPTFQALNGSSGS